MKILTTLTVSGGLNMASAAKDVFTIGTPLENNDGNVDDLYVYANADFKNNVILGSSAADLITVNAPFTSSAGICLNDSSLHINGNATIYYNGMDVFASMGGNNGGGDNGGNNGGDNGGGDSGSYADNCIQQTTQSFAEFGGGQDSYFLGTSIVDGQGQGQNASIAIGHVSASSYNINSDIIELSVNQSKVRLTEAGIDFSVGNNTISIEQIAAAVNGNSGGDNNQNYITDVVSAGEVLTYRSGSTVTLSFNTASLDSYKFLYNTSSYVPQAEDKTIYFSFSPHYNNITYSPWTAQEPRLKGVDYAVSDMSMSINLPPVSLVLGKTFTFINATYVGTTSIDPVGYSSSDGLFTINGKYSVHKITFNPYSSGGYTDYIGTGKITGNNTFHSYLITNAVRDFSSMIAHANETDQHNFITLQAISSSQFGYTWMIRDVSDYEPYTITAI